MTVTRRSLLATSAAGLTVAAASAVSSTQAAVAPTVMITGSNRGIGLQFAKDYAAKGWNVIATTRKPDDAPELKKLAAGNKLVVVERLDVVKAADIAALAVKYKGKPIDILINNAGVVGDFGESGGQKFGKLDHASADEYMQVNALAPMHVTESFFENVKMSGQKKIVALTAFLGPERASYGVVPGAYWYKMSKAALNAAMINLGRDLQKDGIIVVSFSPGKVRVERMADEKDPTMVETADSVRGMMTILDRVTLADSGGFFRYTGDKLQF